MDGRRIIAARAPPVHAVALEPVVPVRRAERALRPVLAGARAAAKPARDARALEREALGPATDRAAAPIASAARGSLGSRFPPTGGLASR